MMINANGATVEATATTEIHIDVPLCNYGTVKVQVAARLDLAQGGASGSASTFDLNGSAALEFSGGVFVMHEESTVSVSGENASLAFTGGGTHLLPAILPSSDHLTMAIRGTATVAAAHSGVDHSIPLQVTVSDNGTLSVSSNATVLSLQVLDDGSVDVSGFGSLAVSQQLQLFAGTLTGNGTLTVESSANAVIGCNNEGIHIYTHIYTVCVRVSCLRFALARVFKYCVHCSCAHRLTHFSFTNTTRKLV
jgi:hypothetical protein